MGIVRVEPCVHAGAPRLHDGIGVDWVRGPWRWQTSSTKQKNPAHHVRMNFSGSQSCIRVSNRLRVPSSQEWEHVDAKRRYVYQHADGAQPAHERVGVG